MFFYYYITSPSSLMISQFHPVFPEFRPRTPTSLCGGIDSTGGGVV